MIQTDLSKLVMKSPVLLLDIKAIVLPMVPMARTDHQQAIKAIVLPMAPMGRTGPPQGIRAIVLPMAPMGRTDPPQAIKGQDLPIIMVAIHVKAGIKGQDLRMLALVDLGLPTAVLAVPVLLTMVLVDHDLLIKAGDLVALVVREDPEPEALAVVRQTRSIL